MTKTINVSRSWTVTLLFQLYVYLVPVEYLHLEILGVVFDAKLTGACHLRMVANTASQRIGIMMRVI